MRQAMGRKLRKTQLRRYTETERRREGWYHLQWIKWHERQEMKAFAERIKRGEPGGIAW